MKKVNYKGEEEFIVEEDDILLKYLLTRFRDNSHFS